jgi:hypothetical protein
MLPAIEKIVRNKPYFKTNFIIINLFNNDLNGFAKKNKISDNESTFFLTFSNFSFCDTEHRSLLGFLSF